MNPWILKSNNSPDCDGWRDKLIGKVVLNDDEETVLQAGEYVRRKDLPQPHRVLSPGSMRTMDFNSKRLNVNVDHFMRVTGVNYG